MGIESGHHSCFGPRASEIMTSGRRRTVYDVPLNPMIMAVQ